MKRTRRREYKDDLCGSAWRAGPHTILKGGSVTFQYSGFHNIIQWSVSTSTELSVYTTKSLIRAPGFILEDSQDSNINYTVTFNEVGTFYYICGIGNHCESQNMMAIVEVSSCGVSVAPICRVRLCLNIASCCARSWIPQHRLILAIHNRTGSVSCRKSRTYSRLCLADLLHAASAGGTFTFLYGGFHNVVEVNSEEEMLGCDDANGVVLEGSVGSDLEFSITFETPGTFYYICSIGSHCSTFNMLLSIEVICIATTRRLSVCKLCLARPVHGVACDARVLRY
eukprot:scaffold383_cov317-Prasinococcus_capsulatus_cf.AAC.7